MSIPARVRAPGPGERLLAITTLFLLAYSLPSSWFTVDNTDIPSGDATVIVVFTLLFALAVTRLVGSWKHVARAIRREPFLLAFMFLLVASTAWSTTPDVTFRRSVALLLTTFFGYYLVVRFPLREIVGLAAIALMLGTVLNVVWIVAFRKYGITQVTTEAATNGDWSGVFPHKNALGRSSALSAVMFVFAARAFPRRRVPYWGFAVLNVLLILGANSKTALVSFLLLMVLMALFTGLRAHATLYGGVAFGLIGTGVLAAAFVTTNLGPISESLGRDVTLTGRTKLWGDVMHEIARRPLLGFGWSGFWIGGNDGPARYVLQRNVWNPPDAHNAVLELLVNVGIVGALLFLIVFFRALFRAVGHVRRQPNILGLFPLAYLSLVLLQSVTEKGVLGRDLGWTMLVVAVVLCARDRAEGRLTAPRTSHAEHPGASLEPAGLGSRAVDMATIETTSATPIQATMHPDDAQPRRSFTVHRPPS